MILREIGAPGGGNNFQKQRITFSKKGVAGGETLKRICLDLSPGTKHKKGV